ncbi:hypothetical protein [Bradyrhizobium elkanii]|jgi:hypothetical protein|uniref:hypothetical protein n=1 Tax=Bradyrhizobium elkanii TaxID=29448 RepID=UPI0011672B75|nr:hypothetical protein [Bradyrhizobium elkanii]BBC02497.1 hypothetical protein BE61_79600 [Bradyrhizobium elkanii USDA 61]GEC57520.1 hypothetical protein BEL01nite_65630 [Bradyrhizobium elkanii]
MQRTSGDCSLNPNAQIHIVQLTCMPMASLIDGLQGLQREPVNFGTPAQARFIVRMGTSGWMVYDRERKGPALIKDSHLAEKLTREQAEHIKESLTNTQGNDQT